MRNLLKALALCGGNSGSGSVGGADWNASEGEAGYVKNRTHYEETITTPIKALNVTWDGNTDGRTEVLHDAYAEDGYSAESGYYKVSDAVLSDAEIKSAKCVVGINADGNILQETISISELWGQAEVTNEVVLTNLILVVREVIEPFTETGLYFGKSREVEGSNEFNMAVKSLTIEEGVYTETILKKLDKKFMPDEFDNIVPNPATKDDIKPFKRTLFVTVGSTTREQISSAIAEANDSLLYIVASGGDKSLKLISINNAYEPVLEGSDSYEIYNPIVLTENGGFEHIPLIRFAIQFDTNGVVSSYWCQYLNEIILNGTGGPYAIGVNNGEITVTKVT